MASEIDIILILERRYGGSVSATFHPMDVNS
jgi:hypothetical protein